MTTTDPTTDTAATTATTPRPARRAVTLRRWTCGVSLIAFPALLVVQGAIVLEDGEGTAMYAAATEHRTALMTSAALLIVSGILTVPAAVGIVRQARDRGAALANWGAAFAVLGAFGHLGIGFFYVMSGALAGGDRAEMVAYIERLNDSTALALTALPLISSFALGMLLLPWAAFRAGLVGIWAPVAATLVVVSHLALPPDVPGEDVIEVVALGALAAVFGALGVRALRTSDAGWGA